MHEIRLRVAVFLEHELVKSLKIQSLSNLSSGTFGAATGGDRALQAVLGLWRLADGKLKPPARCLCDAARGCAPPPPAGMIQ